jgi:hypothetical protein
MALPHRLRLAVVAALALAVAIMHAGIGPGHSDVHDSMRAMATASAEHHTAHGGGADSAPMPGSPCAVNGQVCVSTPVSTSLAGLDLFAVVALVVALVVAPWRPTTVLAIPRQRWRSPPELSALCVWRI